MTPTNIADWDLKKIRPGKTNPRTDFNEAALLELSESIATHGILQHLVGRPDWCIGKTAAEIAQINGNAPATEFIEIVAGERRYRAALKAKLETVPVSVRLFSDQDVLEIHLIENLQREDLDPFEEADGYRQLLALRDVNCAPVHTIKTICQRVNKTRARVYYRLNLLNVPESVRAAVRSKVLGVRTAEAIGAIPTKPMRDAAASEIIKPTDPRYGVGPLTVVQATEFIEENFMRSLSGAQFDQKDPLLVPVIQDEQTGERIGGGACQDCPMRTGNMEAVIGKTKRPDICTNPQCFVRKTDVHFARLMEGAAAEGKKILTEDESFEIFEDDGSLSLDALVVKLSDQPDRQAVRSDFTGKIPSWKKLIENLASKPQILVARDPRGRIVELVNRDLAIEAINLAAKEKGGDKSIFDKSSATRASGTSASSSSASAGSQGGFGGGAGSGGGVSDEEKKKREEKKLNFQITLASMSAVIAAIDDKGMVKGFWDALIRASIIHAGHDGGWLICQRHGLEPKMGKRVEGFASEGVEGAALEYGLTLPDENMKIGYVVELLVSKQVKFSQQLEGLAHVSSFIAFAKLYGVNLAAVQKTVTAEWKKKSEPEPKSNDAVSQGKMHWTRKPEGEFKFNKNGVCENPATLVLPFPKTTKVKVELHVARSKSGWVSAAHIESGVNLGTSVALPSESPEKRDKVFKTAEEALHHEAIRAEFFLITSQVKPAILKTFRAYLTEIKQMAIEVVSGNEPGVGKSRLVKAASTPPARHIWEKITDTKYRCQGCGAAAVKVVGEKSRDADIETLPGKHKQKALLLVEKQFRGKPCSQAELPLGPASPQEAKSKKPKSAASHSRAKTAKVKKKNPPPRKATARRQSRKGGAK